MMSQMQKTSLTTTVVLLTITGYPQLPQLPLICLGITVAVDYSGKFPQVSFSQRTQQDPSSLPPGPYKTMLELGQWPQTYLCQGVLYTLQTLVQERQSLADVSNAKPSPTTTVVLYTTPGYLKLPRLGLMLGDYGAFLTQSTQESFAQVNNFSQEHEKIPAVYLRIIKNSPEPELLELSTEQHAFKPRECGMDSNLDARAPTFAQFSKCKIFSNDSNSSTENNHTWLPLNLLNSG